MDATCKEKREAVTCVAPAGDVAVAGLSEHSLPFVRQAGGKNVATERHALSVHVAQGPRQQTNQGQVVVVAVVVIIGMKEDLVDGVLLFVFFGDKRVVVPHSNFILLGGVAVPVGIRRTRSLSVSHPPG